VTPFWRPAPWRLAIPSTAPPNAERLCLLGGRPCPYSGCPEWQVPTVMPDGERFAALVGPAREGIAICTGCATSATLDAVGVRFLGSLDYAGPR
jgi:hypothetical protein